MGPSADPVLDFVAFDEAQHERHPLHGVVNLFRANICQPIEVEFVHKGIRFAAGPIEFSRWVSPQLSSSTNWHAMAWHIEGAPTAASTPTSRVNRASSPASAWWSAWS